MAAELMDGPLAVSHRRFTDAVHAFCDRQPVWDHGVCRWSSPLYSRVRGSLNGTVAKSFGRRMPSSRMPARTDVLQWLIEVDAEVARWFPGGGTVDRLKGMAATSWRPQDCSTLDRCTELLAAWAAQAQTLLGEAVATVSLRGHRCPVCSQATAIRHRDGETVRSAALVVSELGAECFNCSARWETDQLEFLARLLDCPALPT